MEIARVTNPITVQKRKFLMNPNMDKVKSRRKTSLTATRGATEQALICQVNIWHAFGLCEKDSLLCDLDNQEQ